MANHPLAEVFGYPIGNMSEEAITHRENRLCPYHNVIPQCTKDSRIKPLGVCSIFDGNEAVITCPIRFRQNWYITADAAKFFFPGGTRWTAVPEVGLQDKSNLSVGKVDFILAAHDEYGRIIDFAALEVQAVYISGNIRGPFEYYLQNPLNNMHMVWPANKYYPSPDYLSSSMKRLVPQIIAKGSIMHQWGKKQAVAVQKSFFDRLPKKIPQVPREQADMIWMLYDLRFDSLTNRYTIIRLEPHYSSFQQTLEQLVTYEAGSEEAFRKMLQQKLKKIDRRQSPIESSEDIEVEGLH